MATPALLGQIFTRVRPTVPGEQDTLLITAFLPRTTGTPPYEMPVEVVTYEGIPFVSPPNVLLTIASPHYIVAPFRISATSFTMAINKVGEPAGNENANIYVLIHGALAPGTPLGAEAAYRLNVSNVERS